MRVLVTGTGAWPESEWNVIYNRLSRLPHGTIIIHGCGHGVDTFADRSAQLLGFDRELHPPDFETHGKKATQVRNKEMAESEPDLVLAFWDGMSNGTFVTMFYAWQEDVPIEVTMMPMPVKEIDHRQLALETAT